MKILFVSLGCDKNLVDTEEMLGIIKEQGHTITNEEQEAEVIVINTCCFIHDAKEESIETILEMAEYRTNGNCQALVVAGCLAERYREEIQSEIPEVDAIVGVTAIDDIVGAIDEVLKGKKVSRFCNPDALPKGADKRIVTTGGHYAYLKIAEGCDKHCTYCIIPKIRGNFRSVPMEKVLKQARQLVSDGIKELIVVAQETTTYGIDLDGEKSLHRLLRELCKIEELQWIRLMYCYPEEIDDELITTIKEEPKICNYLDIPIQHASTDVLKRMGRRTSKEQLVKVIRKLRQEIPDIVLRTTLITGFPGETAEDFVEMMEFVDEMEFERLGVFTYSLEEDTPAAKMSEQISEEVKQERQAEIMELQQEISFELDEKRIGQQLTVFIEGKVADEEVYIGRTYADAPNVDGYIFINTSKSLVSGDFVEAKVTAALEYDLIGELINEDEHTE